MKFPLHLLIGCFFLFCSLSTFAKEETLTIKTQAHATILKADGIILPQPKQDKGLSLSPSVAATPPILTILPHGTRVELGTPLVTFDTKELDRRIASESATLAQKKLTLDNEIATLTALEKQTKHDLAEAKRVLQKSATDLDYLTKTEIPSLKKQAIEALKFAQHTLEYTQEELNQLKKMYQADDLTEETEEIILLRHQRGVEKATFQVELAQKAHDKANTIDLPRKQADQEALHATATSEWEKIQRDLPHALKKKRLEVTELERAFILAEKDLRELKSDRQLYPLKSPLAGTLYYGSFENGQWNINEPKKVLRPDGKIPPHQTVLSIIPDSSLNEIHLQVSLQDHLAIQQAKESLNIWLQPLPTQRIPLSIISSSATPSANQTYHYTLTHQDPATIAALPAGSKAPVHLSVYQSDEAIVIPVTALQTMADGTPYVCLKQANGSAKIQAVEISSQTESSAVITAGLQPGQVIFK